MGRFKNDIKFTLMKSLKSRALETTFCVISRFLELDTVNISDAIIIARERDWECNIEALHSYWLIDGNKQLWLVLGDVKVAWSHPIISIVFNAMTNERRIGPKARNATEPRPSATVEVTAWVMERNLFHYWRGLSGKQAYVCIVCYYLGCFVRTYIHTHTHTFICVRGP